MKNFGLVIAGGLLSVSAFANTDGVTLGGYIDAGHTSVMVDKVNGTKTNDKSGFMVNEGALYIGKKWAEWEVYGDFSFGTDFDGAGNVEVAQAYVMQTMDNGFSWKLGKFDTLYGYYSGRGDSHAHRLNSTGLLQNYFPNHVGWAGSYSFSDMLKATLVVANDTETTGSGTRHPDMGITLSADVDTFSADAGVLFTTGSTTAAKNEMGYIGSLVVEGKFEPLMVGVFGLYSKDDSDGADADFGVGLDLGFDMNDKVGFNVRGEYLKIESGTLNLGKKGVSTLTGVGSTVTSALLKSAMAVTAGGQYTLAENVKLKVDYTYMKVDGDSGFDVDPFHVVQAGVVANF